MKQKRIVLQFGAWIIKSGNWALGSSCVILTSPVSSLPFHTSQFDTLMCCCQIESSFFCHYAQSKNILVIGQKKDPTVGHLCDSGHFMLSWHFYGIIIPNKTPEINKCPCNRYPHCFKGTHLNISRFETKLSVPVMQGRHANAIIKSFEMISHLCLL